MKTNNNFKKTFFAFRFSITLEKNNYRLDIIIQLFKAISKKMCEILFIKIKKNNNNNKKYVLNEQFEENIGAL